MTFTDWLEERTKEQNPAIIQTNSYGHQVKVEKVPHGGFLLEIKLENDLVRLHGMARDSELEDYMVTSGFSVRGVTELFDALRALRNLYTKACQKKK